MQDIVILDGARTPIGTFGGSLANITPIDLASSVTKVAMERSGVEGQQIGHVAFGHVINTEPRDMYLSRVAALVHLPPRHLRRLAEADELGDLEHVGAVKGAVQREHLVQHDAHRPTRAVEAAVEAAESGRMSRVPWDDARVRPRPVRPPPLRRVRGSPR